MSTGIVIVTHGPFGRDLLVACEAMLGPQGRCAALELQSSMGREELASQILARLDDFGPSLVLVDMLGGTPWNASLLGGLPQGCEVLAGLSMPILIEALSSRDRLAPRELGEFLLGQAPGMTVSATRLLGEAGA